MRSADAALVIGTIVCFAGGDAKAQAPALQISPVMIQLEPGEMTTTLTVTNVGSQTTTVQLRPLAWMQVAGTDSLSPTNNLVVSPPITEIEGNQSQVFRIVLRTPPAGNEASFRLLLDQLPPAAQPGTIRIALRLSIPVFAAATAARTGHVSWHVELAGGRASLVGMNEGERHVRVLNPVLSDMARAPLSTEPQHGPYILPGTSQSWSIRDTRNLRSGTTLRLTARSDAGPMEATVNVVER